MSKIISNDRQKRQSNIEMLRIVSSLMVVSLHILHPDIIGGMHLSEQSNSVPAMAFTRFLFSFCIVAVDVFVLISGYFMIEKSSPKIGKVINLLLICSVYSAFTHVLTTLGNGKPIVPAHLAFSFVPRSYYIWLYCTLYILSPYINRVVSGLSRRQYTRLIIVIFILFCLWPTIIDVIRCSWNTKLKDVFTVSRDGNGNGFTLVNFVFLYLLGGYLKKYPITFRHKGTKYLELMLSFCCAAATAALCVIFPKINGTKAILGYETFFVVLQAVTFFDFFARINIKNSALINTVAKAALGVYLLHKGIILFLVHYINVEKLFGSGLFGTLKAWLLLLVAGFTLSVILDTLVHLVMTPISKWWSKTAVFRFNPAGNLETKEKSTSVTS